MVEWTVLSTSWSKGPSEVISSTWSRSRLSSTAWGQMLAGESSEILATSFVRVMTVLTALAQTWSGSWVCKCPSCMTCSILTYGRAGKVVLSRFQWKKLFFFFCNLLLWAKGWKMLHASAKNRNEPLVIQTDSSLFGGTFLMSRV